MWREGRGKGWDGKCVGGDGGVERGRGGLEAPLCEILNMPLDADKPV